MDAKAKNYLNRYLDSLPPEQKSAIPSVSADYYCADEYNANVCAELVRIGQKTASCSMELWYSEHGGADARGRAFASRHQLGR